MAILKKAITSIGQKTSIGKIAKGIGTSRGQLMGMYNGAAAGKQSGRAQRFNVKSPYDPVVSLLGIYQENGKQRSNKSLHVNAHSRICIANQKVKTAQMSING